MQGCDRDVDPLHGRDVGSQFGVLRSPPFGVAGPGSPVVGLAFLVQGGRSSTVDFQFVDQPAAALSLMRRSRAASSRCAWSLPCNTASS